MVDVLGVKRFHSQSIGVNQEFVCCFLQFDFFRST